jgi:tetrahydromethanopterin S-methyltransferase subunit F
MNADGTAGVNVEADAGLEAPSLTGIAVGFLVAGGLLLALAVFIVAKVTSRAS